MGVVGVGIERLGIQRRGVDVHAMAGAERVGQDQTYHKHDLGHHLEIDQRLDPDPTDLLEVARTGNAVHDDAEHDRRHDHRNQLQEGVAEDLEGDCKIRHGHAEDDAEDQRRQDLDEQRCIERFWLGGRGRGNGRHRDSPVLTTSHRRRNN